MYQNCSTFHCRAENGPNEGHPSLRGRSPLYKHKHTHHMHEVSAIFLQHIFFSGLPFKGKQKTEKLCIFWNVIFKPEIECGKLIWQ